MNHGMNPELDYVIDEAVAKAHKKLQKAKEKAERKERKERKKVRPAASLDVPLLGHRLDDGLPDVGS